MAFILLMSLDVSGVVAAAPANLPTSTAVESLPPSAPAAPTGLTKISQDNNPLPAFKWNSVAGATSYEAQMDGGVWTSTGDKLFYIQPTVLGKGAHTIQVRAKDSAGSPGAVASLVFMVSVVADLANTKIAYTHFSPWGIWVMNADGSGAVNRGIDNPGDMVWSPDGSLALSAGSGAIKTIYIFGSDGTGPFKLTNDSMTEESAPLWSPDGSRILFYSDRDSQNDKYDLYVTSGPGQPLTRLTYTPSWHESGAVWSPDGSKIAYVSSPDGNDGEIYVINADGSGNTQLTNNTYGDSGPSWSIDGTKILYMSTESGSSQLYMMNVDGSGKTMLPNNVANEYGRSWSPNGKKIAYVSMADGQIYVMNTDGTGVTKLTINTVETGPISWSPDSSQIAFDSSTNGYWDIFVINVDGSALTKITTHVDNDRYPVWSPFFVTSPAAPTTLVQTTPASDNTPTFTWNAASGAASYQVRVDGGTWSGIGAAPTYTIASPLSDAIHTIWVRAADSDGIAGASKILVFTIDITPPTTPTNFIKTSADNYDIPTFTWTASTDATSGIDHYEINLNSGAWTNIGKVTTYTWPNGIPDASYTANLKAVDKVGNSSAVQVLAFTIDDTPPIAPVNLRIVSPGAIPTFEWDAVTGAASYQAKFDTLSYTNISNVTTYTAGSALTAGSHTFYVRAVDAALNIGTASSLGFTVDATNVQWVSHSTPTSIKPGQIAGVPMTIKNTGSQTWSNSGANPVYVSYHWYNTSWQAVEWGIGMWSALPQNVASGQTVSLTASLKAPSTAGGYNLIWDMVQQGVNWFSAGGASLLYVSGITVETSQAKDVQWISNTTPSSIKPGQIVGVPIILTNTGSQAWSNSGANPVYVSYHWYNTSWQAVEWGIGMWSALPQNVASGQTVSLTASLKAPSTAGSYNLLWDVVQQGVTWFSGQGAPLMAVNGITVAASQSKDVQWVSHNTPATITAGQTVTLPITLTNTGSFTWPNSGVNPVYVTYHWYNASWQEVEWGIGLRSSFAQDVATGQTLNLTASLKAPSTPGSYNLLWDVVHEGVTWFSGQGAPVMPVFSITVQ